MDASIYKELKKFGSVKTNVALSKYASFRVGGEAAIFVEAERRSNLVEILNFLTGEGIDFIFLGGGTNLLLPDGEIDKVVIHNKTKELKVEGEKIYSDSGVLFAQLVQAALGSNLAGLEWAAGLPGTVGGAVRGNAGAAGGETAKVVSRVFAWADGSETEFTPSECKFGYRNSVFKNSGGFVLGAEFSLTKGDKRESLIKMQTIIDKRANYYPPHPSAGSFFKNIDTKNWPEKNGKVPENILSAGRIPVGYLNEKAGLKGLRVGGAMVSEQHGNFLINFDRATQADVLKLIETIKIKVYNEFGVMLEEEVQIIS